MFNTTQRPTGGAPNLNQILAHEARLNRIHRLFKTHFNVTEPSIVLEPYLFLGNCISAHDIHRLARLGIRYVLNVAKRDVEVCPYYPNDMRTLTLDLRDDDRENILRAFDQAFAFIDEARRAKSRVLVHCSHGQSRSPAIVIGYLMRSYNVSLEQCLSHVVNARPCVIPNDGFLKQLILYDRFLVERRAQKQATEAAAAAAQAQVVKNVAPTEIPIQHRPPVSSRPVQPSVPVILTPPQRPTISASDTANISSVDSSSMGLTSASSIQSSASNSSIQVIPIQVQSNENNSDKIKQIPIRKVSVDEENAPEKANKKVDKLERKLSTTNLSKTSSDSHVGSSSASSLSNSIHSKRRSIILETKDVKQPSPTVVRSNTGTLNRPHITPYNHVTYDLTPQQWDFINNYPTHFGDSKEHVKTKYITEIYDRATNRFIPTTCCY